MHLYQLNLLACLGLTTRLIDYQGSKYFSTLDLQSGYWQIGLEKESRPITAFHSSMGLMQFRKLCFGLNCAPATFTRLMEKVLKKGYNGTSVWCI